MNCPYCNKEIFGLTGLIELKNFQKHLRKCKKKNQPTVSPNGEIMPANPSNDMLNALEIRAKSGQ